MKIAMISLMWEVCNLGSLNLSTLLREKGYSALDIFMSRKVARVPENERELASLRDLLKKEAPDVVGLSLMTINFGRAQVMSRLIRETLPRVPIVWGGVHPTLSPAECLDHAGAAVRGEGEWALLDVVRAVEAGSSLADIPNVVTRVDGQVHETPVRPFEHELDRFPFPRYDFASTFVLENGALEPMTMDLYRKNLVRAGAVYDIMITRGCPYSCTYCCNWSFKMLYKGTGGMIRSRSIPHVMNEIDYAKKTFPFVQMINLQDDNFLVAKEDVVGHFASEFKHRRLTLICKALPVYITDEKLRLLKDAGLEHIQMGLQGSDRVNREVYKRSETHAQFLEAARLVRKHGLAGRYDVIVDNPYENDADREQMLDTLIRTPKPYWLNIFPLAYFPGTAIAEMGARDGFDVAGSQGYDLFYGKPRRDFYNLLVQAVPRMSTRLARFLLRHRQKKWAFTLLAFYTERWDMARMRLMLWVSDRPWLMRWVKRVYFIIKR